MGSKFDLTGKIAVVTGAGQGLGKSFATSLSEAGAEVFLMARNLERLRKTAEEISRKTGIAAHAIQLDITDEQNIQEACKKVLDTAGRIDILVNNAAVGRSDACLVDESLEEWNRIMETNLTGTFLMMKHVGKIMIGQRAGKVINLASMTALAAMRNPTIGAYDVSKAGVQCLNPPLRRGLRLLRVIKGPFFHLHRRPIGVAQEGAGQKGAEMGGSHICLGPIGSVGIPGNHPGVRRPGNLLRGPMVRRHITPRRARKAEKQHRSRFSAELTISLFETLRKSGTSGFLCVLPDVIE